MFGMPGTSEILIILFVLFVLFGGKKLPEFARGVGKSIGEFKKGKLALAKELKDLESDLSIEKEIKDVKKVV